MAKTPSTMKALGTSTPDFSLRDVVSGNTYSLNDFANKKGLLVMFICNHCPFVIHIQKELAKLGQDYKNSSLGIIAINSNDVESYPDDSPEKMEIKAREMNYVFPYLFDDTQAVARAFDAACTPDFFLFDETRKLVYRGQFDSSRPGNNQPVTGQDLRTAIDTLLAGKPVVIEQKASLGCNIKWRN